MGKKISIEDVKEKMSDRNASEVARRIGISPGTMANFLKGTYNLSLANFQKLVEYLYPEE